MPRVALFVTCLVDMFRPSVGFATIKLLEEAGCTVEVPEAQTCCGQPAWNSGDRATAAKIAQDVIRAFEGYDYVVAPSGSCTGTIVKDYPQMVEEAWVPRAEALAAKTHEITSFLTDVLGITSVAADVPRLATYHDSCSGLRTLRVKEQPRALLASAGITVREMEEAEVCCGFGGTFCVKYPDISTSMVGDKVRNATETGAEMLLAGDLGCLMNMAGKASREGRGIEVRHVVEVLAGMTDTPAIGEGK
ncbi:(Fe-S)-binding protein [Pontivivens insulae]|uniref:Lactate utilization protein A n=1 Tax=Pontivivens insulae TaxID=1639689 RepID=A0A2R8A8F6_9RHOB|nr:(Fe-S)-binding protein [Pontivivens insulae]RED18621.1 L-lactate dehydrogenase complex protein LldE [Pontivivens insulae]SPF28519.1 Lactate utilization protein A [Pontivivens insulae]